MATILGKILRYFQLHFHCWMRSQANCLPKSVLLKWMEQIWLHYCGLWNLGSVKAKCIVTDLNSPDPKSRKTSQIAKKSKEAVYYLQFLYKYYSCIPECGWIDFGHRIHNKCFRLEILCRRYDIRVARQVQKLSNSKELINHFDSSNDRWGLVWIHGQSL